MKQISLNTEKIVNKIMLLDSSSNALTWYFGKKQVNGINLVDSSGRYHTLTKVAHLIEAVSNKTISIIINKEKTQLLAEVQNLGSFVVLEEYVNIIASNPQKDEDILSVFSLALSAFLDKDTDAANEAISAISAITDNPSEDAIIEATQKITGRVVSKDNFNITLWDENTEEGKAKLSELKEAIRTSSDTYEALAQNIATPDNFFKFSTETSTTPVVDETAMDDIFRFDKSDWDLEAQKLIPSMTIYESYIKDGPFYRMAKLVSKKTRVVAERIEDGGFLKSNAELLGENGSGAINLLVYGPPGSGKTQAIDALAAFMNIPVYRISGTDKAEDGDIKGKAGIDEHGNFKNIITVARQAIENGGILCIEEYNLMPPALFQGILGQTVVYPYKLLTNEETYIDRHPHCIIALTKNTNTEGTVEQNQAFNNRFTMRYFPEQQEELFVSLISRYDTGYGKADKNTAKKLYKIYKKLGQYVCSAEIGEDDLALELSLRTCYQVLEDMFCADLSLKEAIKEQLGGHINHNNPEVGKQIFNLIDSVL